MKKWCLVALIILLLIVFSNGKNTVLVSAATCDNQSCSVSRDCCPNFLCFNQKCTPCVPNAGSNCAESELGKKKCFIGWTGPGYYIDEVRECKLNTYSQITNCFQWLQVENCKNTGLSCKEDGKGGASCICASSNSCKAGSKRCKEVNSLPISPAGPDEIQVCNQDNCGWTTVKSCTMDQDCIETSSGPVCTAKQCPYCCPASKTCTSLGNGVGCYSGTCCYSEAYCVASCKSSGQSCSASSECCSGLACLSNNKCGTPLSSCKSSGQSCTSTSECCSSLVCLANGQCGTSCKTFGVTCTSSTECCSGLACSGGECVAASCKSEDQTCIMLTDCCSNLYCSNEKKCKAFPTGWSDIKVISCQFGHDHETCDKLDELGIVTKSDCCSGLGLCCSANTVSINDFKSALIKGIQSYFTASSVLTKDELKDMIWAYFSTASNIVDLNIVRKYSGEKLIDIYNKAKGIITPTTQTCSAAGGYCKTQACNTYTNCASLSTGTCTSGLNCCSGTCTAPPGNYPKLDQYAPAAGPNYYGKDDHYSAGQVKTYTLPVTALSASQNINRLKVLIAGLINGGDVGIKLISPSGQVWTADAGGTSDENIELRSQTSSYPNCPADYLEWGDYTLEITAHQASDIRIWWNFYTNSNTVSCTNPLDQIAPKSGGYYGFDDKTFASGAVKTYCLPTDVLYPGDFTTLEIDSYSLGVVPGGDISLKLTSPDGKVFLKDSPTSSDEMLIVQGGWNYPSQYLPKGKWTLEITAKISSRIRLWWYMPY